MKTLMKFLVIAIPLGSLFSLLAYVFFLRGLLPFDLFANLLFFLFTVNVMGLIYYLRHVWTNVAITKDAKILWTVGMMMFAMVSEVIYWFKFVRKT